MKLTIDTETKTIEFEHSIKLLDLIEQLKQMLPDWKSYTINSYPCYNYPSQIYPLYHWSTPTSGTFTIPIDNSICTTNTLITNSN